MSSGANFKPDPRDDLLALTRGFELRISKLREAMAERGVKAFLAYQSTKFEQFTTLYYLTGAYEFEGAAAVIPLEGDPVMVVKGFEAERARAESWVKDIREVPPGEEAAAALASVLKELGLEGAKIGVDDEDLLYSDYLAIKAALPGVELVPMREEIQRMKMVKSPDEIELVERAARCADEGCRAFVDNVGKGLKEVELSAEIESAMKRAGAGKAESWVAFGENSVVPHHHSDETRVGGDGLAWADMGAAVRGYWSDVTRTVAVGKLRREQREIYEVVYEALLAAVDAVKPGAKAEEVDAAARSLIEKRGYGKYFKHSTGHGVGLRIHEPPRIGPKSDVVLEPGMVFTVEPGIYVPGIGGVRIEDDVVVTERGCRVLNKFERFLI